MLQFNQILLEQVRVDFRMSKDLLQFTLRVDRFLFEKFKYVAAPELRSANKEIEQCLKRRIAEYEKENGEIKVNFD